MSEAGRADLHADAAERIVATLTRRRQTAATAESLTGGMVAAELTAVPGASAVFSGGFVVYTAVAKTVMTGVPADLIDSAGVVSDAVAEALAAGARRRMETDWAAATTGVAGPQPHGGQPPGVMWVAVAGPAGLLISRRHVHSGSRADIRRAGVQYALNLLASQLDTGD